MILLFLLQKKGNKQIRNKNGYILKTYKKIPMDIKFRHNTINNYNQHLCGGWSIHCHIDFEEVDRVCQGLKPVGISHTWNLEEAKNKSKEILKKGFLSTYDYGFIPNNYIVT